MPGIRVKEGEPFERALRRFTKTCEKAGIMSEIRKHQHFEKPSAKRKRKINAAKRKNQKRMELKEWESEHGFMDEGKDERAEF